MLAKTPAEMGENTETFLDALNAFERKPSREIPSELEQLLCRIARNGEPLFPWSKLKPLVITKLENVIQDYIQSNPCEEVPMLPNVENVKFDDMRERLLRALNAFNSAPFTMQRLCELLTHPKRYYQRSDKFMRGVEKNVQVVSTVTPTGKRITHSCEVRNRNLMMNGIPSDSHTQASTLASDSQLSGEPAASEETNHTNANGSSIPQLHDTVVSPAQEQSVDSTRQAADPTTSELVMDTSERTTSSDNLSAVTDGDRESEEMLTHNEAEACKSIDVEDHTAAGDSDDSDENKGDQDQDSCSSLDSADSGDSSPDSALPPRTGYFDSLPPTDPDTANNPSVDQKGPDVVESTTDTEKLLIKDKSTPEASSKLPVDQEEQSHSSITSPALEDQASPLVTSAAIDSTDTRTDQSEETEEAANKVDPPTEDSASPTQTLTQTVDQSNCTSTETTVEADVPMEQE